MLYNWHELACVDGIKSASNEDPVINFDRPTAVATARGLAFQFEELETGLVADNDQEPDAVMARLQAIGVGSALHPDMRKHHHKSSVGERIAEWVAAVVEPYSIRAFLNRATKLPQSIPAMTERDADNNVDAVTVQEHDAISNQVTPLILNSAGERQTP